MTSRRAEIAAAILSLCAFGVWPTSVDAQVFIASHPHPNFGVGPLLVSVDVGQNDVRPAHRPVTVTVLWSLALPADGAATEVAQDLYLLWPGDVPGAAGNRSADAALVHQVAALGFRTKEYGRLHVAGRPRSDAGPDPAFRPLGEAPYVTFAGDGAVGGASGATLVRIPWVPELASPDWLVRIELPVRDVIVSRPVSWVEDLFWGRRYVVTVGFGDLDSLALYPFYFGVRDRVLPLTLDFSALTITFGDAHRLRVDDVVPPSALRREGAGRPSAEAISLALGASRGLIPQILKVQFTYAPQRLPARPLVISALFVVLGGIIRWLYTPVTSGIGRTWRAHVFIGRAPDAGRVRGSIPRPEVLQQLRPGETTYEEVLRRCGPGIEEQVRLPGRDIQALRYRERRAVPVRGWSLGWLATVRSWQVEDREIELTFERDVVRGVLVRVRRARRRGPPT